MFPVEWWVIFALGLLVLLCWLKALGAETENRGLRRDLDYWKARYWDEVDARSGQPLEWPPRRWN